MKKTTLYLFSFFLVLSTMAQNDLTDKKHYHDTYIADSIIDKEYGITMYEKLNMMLGGDTVRNDQNGYAANGFVEDYFTTGNCYIKGFM